MIRSELVKRLQTRLQNRFEDKSDVKLAVDHIIDYLKQELKNDNRIEVRGFGTFTPKTLPTRISRNPSSGETFQLPPRKTINFKAGKDLREQVDKSRSTHEIEK